MASSTAVSEDVSNIRSVQDERPPEVRGQGQDQEQDQEQEPLLGRPGDVSQKPGKPLPINLILGTAVLAQVGVWILFAHVWAAVFSADWIYMLQHPLGNSAGIALLLQATLILQPTHTKSQKLYGAIAHGFLSALAMGLFVWAFYVIEKNKGPMGNGHHWKSPHAYMGFITYVLLFIQFVVGAVQFWVPLINPRYMWLKKIWKWHRVFGYIVLVMILLTTCAATQTDYVKQILRIRLWPIVTCSVLILAGAIPRVKKQKLPGYRGQWW